MKLTDIKIFVINLNKREDRLEEISKMLEGYNWKRIEAVETSLGYIGCVLSHIKCLKKAIIDDLPEVIIMEDDHRFINEKEFKYPSHSKGVLECDVCLLTGKSIKGEFIDENFMKIQSARHTDCYLVKRHYYKTMIKCFYESLLKLLNNYEHQYYIDVYWDKYMRIDNFICLRKLIGYQKEDYSDIQNMEVKRNKIKLIY
jgi:glycosyl transferase, family 25